MKVLILKHKDVDVAALTYEENATDNPIGKIKIYNKQHMPFLGSDNPESIKKWFRNRYIPDSRPDLKDAMRSDGVTTPAELLIKNKALSLTDCYWLCDIDDRTKWDDVKITTDRYFLDRENMLSPNPSLGGNMPKKWISVENEGKLQWAICKSNEGGFKTQAANEVFATMINHMQENVSPEGVSFVPYSYGEDYQECICPAFTSEKAEFVSAYECIGMKKITGSMSIMRVFIDTLTDNGLDKDYVQDFMDYQIMFDFAISNTDRHLNNIGVLRDPDTLRFISMAPIFDNGNSMFFDDYSRHTKKTILERKITGFATKEEKMLKYVQDRSLFTPERLPDKESVFEFYSKCGIIGSYAKAIAHNYDLKKEMLIDFCRGIPISAYHEKHEHKYDPQTPSPEKAKEPFDMEEEIKKCYAKAAELKADNNIPDYDLDVQYPC